GSTPEFSMNLAVLISGRGTNLQAIMDAIEAGTLDASIGLVVSNRGRAYGLQRAQHAGIPTLYFPFRPYKQRGDSRETYDRELASLITTFQPDLLVLAGWMHILSPIFLDQFPGRVINLHPALPGMFPGTGAVERAYEAWHMGGINVSGCMIHYAVPEVDAGPVIVVETVPFREGDTLESYKERLHAAEHRIIVEAIRRIITERT
ncbi:MAG: phosphoribosylglycinamide formyltransferase, partial [Anaerolineae bacterium]